MTSRLLYYGAFIALAALVVAASDLYSADWKARALECEAELHNRPATWKDWLK